MTFTPRYWCLWVVVMILNVSLTHTFQSVNCAQVCRDSLECDSTLDACDTSRCLQGCQSHLMGLVQGCERACNISQVGDTFFGSEDSPCLQGCQEGVDGFLDVLESVKEFQAPRLISNSIGATALKLVQKPLDLPQTVQAQSMVLQVKILGAQTYPDSGWHNQMDLSNAEEILQIDDLLPFTSYQFRLGLTFSNEHRSVYSQPSPVIRTLAEGAPDPPKILRIQEASFLHLTISWLPPKHPRGIVAFYRLHLRDQTLVREDSFRVIKDIKIEHHLLPPFNYTTGPLQHDTLYTVELQAVNIDEIEGTKAIGSLMTSPKLAPIEDGQVPMLFTAYKSSVFQKNLLADEIWEIPHEVFRVPNPIVAIANHVARNLIFLLDDQGKVYQNSTEITLNLDGTIKNIVVDWLNNELIVFTQDEKLFNCSIDTKNCASSPLAEKLGRIVDLQLDSVNGNVFWHTGNEIWTVSKCDPSSSKRIVHRAKLGSMGIDFGSNRLLVVDLEQDELLMLDLVDHDHAKILNLTFEERQRPFQSMSEGILFHYNDSYYWTNANVLHQLMGDNRSGHFQSSFKEDIDLRTSVFHHPEIQPIPVPLNPVLKVELSFGTNFLGCSSVARVKWEPSDNSANPCVWQQWTYDIRLESKSATEKVFQAEETNLVTCVEHGTVFNASVRAVSEGGKSEWSIPVSAQSLPEGPTDLVLTWIRKGQVFQSDLLGTNHSRVELPFKARHVACRSGDAVLLSTDTSLLSAQGQILFKANAEISGLLFEPFSESVYTMVPKSDEILRIPRPNSSEEVLKIPARGVKALDLDSLLAKLCWIRYGTSIVCSSLFGTSPRAILELDLWSESLISDLVIDGLGHRLFFTRKDGSQTVIHQMDLEDLSIPVQVVTILEHSTRSGSLNYYHDKLQWIQDGNQLVTFDLVGQSWSTILLGGRGGRITDLCVQGAPRQMVPQDLDITPLTVDLDSLKLEEDSKLVWRALTGEVTYHLLIQVHGRQYALQTTTSELDLAQEIASLTPNTEVRVTLIAASNWSKSPQVEKTLFTPPQISSPPQHLRAFHNAVNSSIIVRWNPPKLPNGHITGYQMEINSLDTIIVHPDTLEQVLVELPSQQLHIDLRCQNNAGLSPASTLLIQNRFVLPSLPQILIYQGIQGGKLDFYDLDRRRIRATYDVGAIQTLDFQGPKAVFSQGGSIFALNLINHVRERVLTQAELILHLRVDWISNCIFFVAVSGSDYSIRRFSVDSGVLSNVTHTQDDIQHMELDPLTNTLYYTTLTSGKFQLNKLELSLFGRIKSLKPTSTHAQCSCFQMDPRSPFYFTLRPNIPEQKASLTLLTHDGSLFATDNGCECQLMRKIPAWSQLSSDGSNLYWKSHEFVQYLNLQEGQISHFNGSSRNEGVIIRPFCPDCQMTPIKQCLVPSLVEQRVTILEAGEDWLRVSLPQFRAPCTNSLPQVEFTIYYYVIESQGHSELPSITPESCSSHPSLCLKLQVPIQGPEESQFQTLIKDLEPFTRYGIYLSLQKGKPSQQTIPTELIALAQTLDGQPGPPENVTATALDPETIEVAWLPPKVANGKFIIYDVHYELHKVITTSRIPSGHRQKPTEKEFSVELKDLEPGEIYKIWVEARTGSSKVAQSAEIEAQTFSRVSLPEITTRTPRSVTFIWRSPPIKAIQAFQFRLVPLKSNLNASQYQWPMELSSIQPGHQYQGQIKSLNPGTQYGLQGVLTFRIGQRTHTYIWPQDSKRILVETPPDAPLIPGQPYVMEKVSESQVYLAWNSNNDLVESFELQARIHDSNVTVEDNVTMSNWSVVYADTSPQWPISGLSDAAYLFRVRAKNEFGWSQFSEDTPPLNIGLILSSKGLFQSNSGTLIGLSAGIVGIIGVLVVVVLIIFLRRPWDKKSALGIQRHRELELATIHELPVMLNGGMESNPTYGVQIPSEQEMEDIPKLKRNQITLVNFIGCGAFGQVYEGRALGIRPDDPSNGPSKVAIKMLGKQAGEEERVKFLQEALAMFMFKHPNIITLIGICLDNNPPFLVLELMEGGDLLAYFKQCRDPRRLLKLTLADLGQICCDVAKGCAYLSDMQYIHRDIAARNCLVSSLDAKDRVVKIGDFGLARDIYKDAYYRKNGQSLLPIKWMAPESLADNKYTTKSDVWSFGVLLWEIMNLGRCPPYPDMNNLDVMVFVPNGGHPKVPPNCPERLKNLMLRCWAFHPDQRPTFRDCLHEVQELLVYEDELAEIPSFCQFNPTSHPNSVSMHNSRDTWKTSGLSQVSQATTAPMIRGRLGVTSPNYLQLLHDSDPSNLVVTPNSSMGSSSTLRTPRTLSAQAAEQAQYKQPKPLPRYGVGLTHQLSDPSQYQNWGHGQSDQASMSSYDQPRLAPQTKYELPIQEFRPTTCDCQAGPNMTYQNLRASHTCESTRPRPANWEARSSSA